MNNSAQQQPALLPDATAAILEIDQALSDNKKQKNRDKVQSLAVESENGFFEKSILSLPQVMRWLGVIIMGVAAGIVLMSGDTILSPVTRHWVLVGGTGLLGVLGLVFGIYGKETKGARTFFALAVALVPVLFSQLGAMLFSLQPQPYSTLPGTMLFRNLSVIEVAVHSCITILVSSAIIYFGFLTLARAQVKILTVTYILLNCAVLIPLRENGYIGFVLLGQAFVLWYFFHAVTSRENIMKTFEGLMCKVMLFTPPAIVFSRSLFYSINPEFIAMQLVITGLSLFILLKKTAEKSAAARFGQLAGTIIASAGWLVYSIAGIQSWGFVSVDYYACIIGLPFALVFAAVSFFVPAGSAPNYRSGSALVSGIVILIAYMSGGALAVSLISIGAGMVFVALGTWQKEKFCFITGAGIVAGGLGYTVWRAIELTAENVWITLAAVSIITLVIASCLEMLKHPLKKYLLRFNINVKEWR